MQYKYSYTHVVDIETHIEDDTSIPRNVNSLTTTRSFPILDPHNLKHHDIYMENIPQIDDGPENTPHIQINIPTNDEETRQISCSEESLVSDADDNFDDFVTVEKHTDDIYLTEPKSKI